MRTGMGSPKLEKAKEWINGKLLDNPEIDVARKLKLIEEASLKFDLSPTDGEYLHAHLKVNQMSQEEIREKREAIKIELLELEEKIVEKKEEWFALMKKCKHPNEYTVQDSNLHCPDCGHFD